MKLHKSAWIGLVLSTVVASACEDPVVIPPDPPPPIELSLSPDEVTIPVGGAADLLASVTGGEAGTDRTVTCSSSNTAIATVAVVNGNTCRVTGVTDGQAQVSAASVADNSAADASNVIVTPLAQPPTISINRVTTGNTNTPVQINNVFGQIDITVNLDNPDNAPVERVEWLIDNVVVFTQNFAGGAADVAAAVDEVQAEVELVGSVNTAVFDAATGAVTFPNGPHTISAQVIGPQGTIVATAPPTQFSQLVFNNANVLTLTVTEERSAADPTGLVWVGGDLAVSALPVIYTGGNVSSVTLTVTDAAAGGSSEGAESETIAVSAAGPVAHTFEFDDIEDYEDANTVVMATSILGGQQGPGANQGIRLDNLVPTVAGAITFPLGSNGWIGPNVSNASLLANVTSTDGGVMGQVTTLQSRPDGAPSSAWANVAAVADLAETTTNSGAGSVDLRGRVCDALLNCANTLTSVEAGVDKTAPTNVLYTGPAHMDIVFGGELFILNGSDGLSGPLDFFGTIQRLETDGDVDCDVGSGGACNPVTSQTNVFDVEAVPDGFITFDAGFRDQALNLTAAPVITVVRDATSPFVQNIVLPSTLPSGGQATHSATATDNLQLKDQLHRTIYANGFELPYGPEQAVGPFNSVSHQSANLSSTVDFIKSIEISNPAPSGALFAATAARFSVRDWGNNSSTAFNNYAAGTVPAGSSASLLGVNSHLIQIQSPAGGVICDPDGGNAPCATDPTTAQLVAEVRGESGSFNRPFTRVVIYRWDGANFHFVGSTNVAVSSDNGVANDPLGRLWTYGPVPFSGAGFDGQAVNLVAVGVDAQGDALITNVFAVVSVTGT